MVHGDYHPGNLMFEEGLVTRVLDWEFLLLILRLIWHISQTSACCMCNNFKDIPLEFCEQYLEKIFNAYSKTRPVNQDRIRVFRVLELLRLLCFTDKVPKRSKAMWPSLKRRPAFL